MLSRYGVMITREQKLYKVLIFSMIDKLPNINQWRRSFHLTNVEKIKLKP